MGASQVSEPLSAIGGGWLAKVAGMKLAGPVAALVGALIVAAVRTPKSRGEWFSLLAAAVGISLIGGSTAVIWADHYFEWINLANASTEERDSIVATVHGVLGMLGLGFANLALYLRDRMTKHPKQVLDKITGADAPKAKRPKKGTDDDESGR